MTSWIDVLRMEVNPRVNKGEATDNWPRDNISIELGKEQQTIASKTVYTDLLSIS